MSKPLPSTTYEEFLNEVSGKFELRDSVYWSWGDGSGWDWETTLDVWDGVYWVGDWSGVDWRMTGGLRDGVYWVWGDGSDVFG